jgi:thioredoxin-like negative regulator of GroEL
MEQMSEKIYRDLMAVGLLGTIYRCEEDSEAINDIVEATLSEPLQFRICRAVVSGMAGVGNVASGTLKSHVDVNPDDEAARLALAISLILAGDPEGRRAVESLLATTNDIDVRRTAHSMLEVLPH